MVACAALQASLQEFADALNGADTGGNCNVAPAPSSGVASPSRGGGSSAGNSFYADPNSGSDSNPGSMAAPFLTVGKVCVAISLLLRAGGGFNARLTGGVGAQGVAACRATTGGCTLVLRAGTFFLPETLQLDSQDSGLTIEAYQGEEVCVGSSAGLWLACAHETLQRVCGLFARKPRSLRAP
jgi:hypothetical protein